VAKDETTEKESWVNFGTVPVAVRDLAHPLDMAQDSAGDQGN